MLKTMPRIALLSGALLCTACGSADDANAGTAGGKARTATAINVEVRKVESKPLHRELVAVGSLLSDESVMLRPEIGGRVVTIGFKEGQAVKSGQLLIALDDSIYRAQFDQARANYELARRNFERAQELLGRKLIAQADRDQASATFDAATAAMALAQARLDQCRIVAPFAGVAGLRLVSPGDVVAPGQDLVNLEDLSTLKLDFRLDESALPALAVGQALDLSVDSYPGETFKAELYAIDPRVSAATRSIGLRARLANPEGRLRAGQFARVRLAVDQRVEAIVVPEQAVFPRGEKQFAYVVVDGKAQLRELQIGQRSPGSVEVLSGLSVGEALVYSGLQHLGDGVPVSVQSES
ncbi:MAG TPA: efflux RND transporter periplasmic adaptor subunit [Fontimonas sp.]